MRMWMIAAVAVAIVSTAPFTQAMEMDHGMAASKEAKPWDKAQDAAFLSGMIVHHQGALAMAKKALANGKDAQVKAWAQAVVDTQQKEIDQMAAMLPAVGGRDDTAVRAMDKTMKDMLAMPTTGDADRDFVVMMIPHHAGAVDMSLPALVGSGNAELRALARDIIVAQAKEIADFKDWLDAHPAQPATAAP